MKFGIINPITKLHLVCISTESSKMHGSMNIKLLKIGAFLETDFCRSQRMWQHSPEARGEDNKRAVQKLEVKIRRSQSRSSR
jgi:hypothetical protein